MRGGTDPFIGGGGKGGDVAGLKCFSLMLPIKRMRADIGFPKGLGDARVWRQKEESSSWKSAKGIGSDSWIRCCQKYRDSCQMSRIRCQTSQALEESSLQSSVENILTEDRFVLFKPLIYIFNFFYILRWIFCSLEEFRLAKREISFSRFDFCVSLCKIR